ncbi:hypothetical protein FPOAC2_06316 [Fusarium poae]|uniref:Peptidase A1 domain-containing protein n=1 Tax=Fusarium poae TaxID=36050 RepID=A0A1B8AX82_FUSPO|nr:hypothetical protein FPOAC1_006197 [Fusarium poae]KAG8672899.1 hypothetical protein FPOAC1_006197 [Fusarium poae]OBS25097.1 hypothetical protein FPOA_05632 [Fusarium poae]
MHLSTALGVLSLLSTAKAQANVHFGPAFSLGPTKSWIREATTTLVLPRVPGQKDRLALWPGMGTSSGSLIQALAVSFADPRLECGGQPGQWCTWASTLQGTQLGDKKIPASPGARLTIHYKYNDATQRYDQSVAIDGTVVSTLSTTSGHAEGWGTAVECQDAACVGTVDAHDYIDTTIILNQADPSFSNTLGLNQATSSGLRSSDGGKTWTVGTISHKAFNFNFPS